MTSQGHIFKDLPVLQQGFYIKRFDQTNNINNNNNNTINTNDTEVLPEIPSTLGIKKPQQRIPPSMVLIYEVILL